jgi:sulfur carrier protein
MRIILNGESCQVTNTRLDLILLECKYLCPTIATALNDVIVHKQVRASTHLTEDDRLEVVAPIGGG